jgi:ABC-type branched-subunit amino acid transport system ATPase component
VGAATASVLSSRPESCWLIGPNGAGTTFNLLNSYGPTRARSIWLARTRGTGAAPDLAYGRGRTFQSPRPLPR